MVEVFEGVKWIPSPMKKQLVLLVVVVTATIFGRGTESSTDSVHDVASISIGPRDQKVIDNGVAAFFCRASGWPTSDVQWRRNGRRISPVRPRYQMVNSTRGSVLRIEPVRASDEGQIECRLETEDGKWTSANASLQIYPTIEDAGNGFPRISEGPLLRAVQKGESVEMPCTALGSPQPNITWYKDFVPIFSSSEARVTVRSTGWLHIEEVDESDEGKYDCSAENELGSAFSHYANLYVRVRRVAPHFSIPPENVEVTLGGSANLTCVAVGSPMPYVKWKLGSKEITAAEEIPIGKNVLLLTNVRQSSVYTCVASSDLGTIVANAAVNVKALPRSPTHLVASDVTSTSVRLRWSVAGGVDPPVDSHVILYRRRPGPSRKPPFEEVEHFERNAEHVIASLSPHTVYEFHVVAVNNVGRSASSNTVEVLTLESKPGSPPQNVRARPISSSTVVVQWDEPKTPNGVVKGYKIFYTLTPHEPLSKWSVQTVDNSQLTTVSNLITNRTYAVTVLGFTAVGDGPASEPVQVKTQQGVPSQPNNVRGEALSSRTIQVTWDAPDPPGELLESYELFYNDSSFKQNVHVTISPPRTSFLMEDLTPHTIYLVKVAARSSRGEGASSPTISVTTLEDAPSVAPLMVQGEAIDSTSFRVTWSPIPRDQQNGVVIGYRILYAKVASNQGVDGPLVVKVTVPGTERSQVVKGAEKWTQYSVWVQGFTRKGDGPVSDVIVIQTAEDVPGEPRKVRAEAVNASAVIVHWRSPAENEQNGIIRGYHVIYSKVSDDDTPLGQTLVFDIMDGTAMESIVTGLESNTEYQFQVAAYTRKGDGLRSRPKKVKTKGAVLGAPRNVRLVMVQEDPPVVEISWQAPPRSPLAAILGYRVQYGVRGSSSDEMDERQLEADKYKYTTGFLDRGVEYEFRVSSKNNVDYGEPAIERMETPEGIPAGAPLNTSFGHLTATSVQLVWDPPAAKHRNGQIVLYEIIYHERLNYIDDWMTNTTDTWMTIEGLDPGSGYLFQIRAYTKQGCGPWSGPVEVVTPKLDNANFVPSPPSGIALRRVSPSIVRVSWDPLLPSDGGGGGGGIAGFQIFYSTYAMADLENWKTQEIEGMSSSSVEITGLQPHATYFVKIRTVLEDGRFSDFSKVAFERGTAIPESAIPDDMVKDFFARKYGPTFISLEWNPPRKTGLQFYKVNYRGTKFYRDESGVERVIDSEDKKVVTKDEREVTVDRLIPSTVYAFNISAYFADSRWGTTTNINVETDVDVPPPMQAPRIRGRTGRGITLRLFTASERNGKITRYYLVVAELDVSDKRSANSFTLPELSRQGTEESAVAWIAAAFTFLPKEFTIGGGNSSQRSSTADAVALMMRGAAAKYVNRPLTNGKAYRVFVRAYTSENKFTSSPYSEKMEAGSSGRGGIDDDDGGGVVSEPIGGGVGTEPDESAGIEILWVVAPVCIAVVVVLLGVLAVVFIRRSCRREEPLKLRKVPLLPGEMVHRSHDPVELRRINFLTPGMASHPPIALSQLSDVINRLKSNDREEFSREYESIEPGQQFTWEASSADVNKIKNRYANVIAYDHSRVTLRPIEGVPGSDYVNANFMDGYCRQNAYIATQGPLVETFGDFWRMIWEQRSTTIVMMTKLEERNRIKCDQYWPSRGTELYGTTQVSIVDVIEMATFTIRTFQISQVNFLERREVHQLQFTAWPDHGVPDHPTPLLNFIRKVKAVTPPDAGPMIVHCSAGVGRSGTFIVIDAMLDRIQREKMIDIYGHVTCLRSQRNYMVQTEDQYVFIYDAVLEAVESGNTEVPADSLYVHVQHLTHLEPGETITGMELEFKKLNNMKLNPMLFVSASLPINKYKNRLVNILPYESTRVCLQPIRGVEGSDYINANFIDGYRFRKTYIATQGPMVDTTEDFWRMLWEHNCNIIVMLTKLKELGREKCSQYWPEERSARYRYFVVDPMAQYNMPLYVLREFKVTDARDGQSRIIRQFQFTDWPEQGVPASGEGFIEFIGHVQKTKEQFGQDGPIVVHCSMGVGRTGVFVVLSIVLERMRYEGVVDLFQTVKMLRTQRPAMVQSEEQYTFCYRAALEYLSSFDHYTN